MRASELDRNLSLVEESESNLTTIITINARHATAPLLLSEYADVMSQYNNAGLCFVAGSATYLNEEERKLEATPRIVELVRSARSRLRSAPIFVGSEGLRDVIPKLADEYSTIPFMLLGPRIHDDATQLRFNGNGIAVYCPCDLSNQTDSGLVKSFGQYALRRRWVRRVLRREGHKVSQLRTEIANGGIAQPDAEGLLVEAIHKLALCGTNLTIRRLHELSGKGVAYVAVLLAQENAEQNTQLSNVVREFHNNPRDKENRNSPISA